MGIIQGTAATAVAGVYGALAVQGKDFSELTKQRIVLIGAGSAGMGVARMLALGMLKQVLLHNHRSRSIPPQQSLLGARTALYVLHCLMLQNFTKLL